jgi:3-phenylpropionate/trans-cinnamate dioxygenase ferredoxin reductase component
VDLFEASKPVVIAGAGTGGVHLALALRAASWDRGIVLVSDESHLPYHRPPLSKGYLLGSVTDADMPLRPADFYQKYGIDLRLGVAVAAVDRDAQRVRLADGTAVGYSHLVFATGSRHRMLDLEGHSLDGVCSIDSWSAAAQVRHRITAARRVLVIGGGFIGLEFASAARTLGKSVVIVEAAARLMGRALTPSMSAYFADIHHAAGSDIRFGARVARLLGRDGRVAGAQLEDGTQVAADLVVVAVGADARDELARQAGLRVDNGIVVDAFLATGDPRVFAIGDCARFPRPGRPDQTVRLESIQNATDQARTVAARIAGTGHAAYTAVPWFWSEQLGRKLQIAGLTDQHDTVLERGDREINVFSLYSFLGDIFVACESVGSPRDHAAARRALASGQAMTFAQVGSSETTKGTR